MELTEEFINVLKKAVTSIASSNDTAIEVNKARFSDSFSDIFYTVTLPRAESKIALQRLEASIRNDSLSTLISNALGTPVSITGTFSLLDLDQPTVAPTPGAKAVIGDDKIARA